MRKLSLCLLFILIFGQIPAFAGTELVINQDFLTSPIGKAPQGNWVINKNTNDKAEVVSYESSRAFKIYKGMAGNIANTGGMLYLENQLKGTVTIEAEMMSDNVKGNIAALYLLDSEGRALVCCTFNNQGYIGVYYNGQWNYEKEYQAKRWYKLRAEIDLTQHKFKFYVDDELVCNDAATRNTSSDNISIINTYITTTFTTAYINYIRAGSTSIGIPVEIPEIEEETDDGTIYYGDNDVIVSEDFEGYSLGEITENSDGFSVLSETGGRTEIATLDNSKVVKISKASTDTKGQQALVYTFDTARARALGNSITTVEYRIRNDDTTKFVGAPYILSLDNSPAVTIGFGNLGYAYMNASANSIGEYSQGQWYRMKIVQDYFAKKIDLYINDELVKTDENFRGGTSTNMKTIKFYVEAAGAVCFVDDFKVTSSNKRMPEPADEIMPLESTITQSSEEYVVTKSYVSTTMSLKPPVIVDTLGKNETSLILKSDAISMLLESDEDLTIRADDFRIKIPASSLGGINNGHDVKLTVIKNYDANSLWAKIPDKSGIANTGIAYKISLSSLSNEALAFSDHITIKQSGCVAGYDGELTVVKVDNGIENTISKQDVLAEGVLFKTTESGEFLAVKSRKRFNDISEEQWSYPYIGIVSAKGIMTGTAENVFSAESNLTRGECALMIARALNLKPVLYDSLFEDMTGQEYCAGEVAALFANNLIDRTILGDAFYPEKMVTRAEIAYFVLNAYLKTNNRHPEELTKFYEENALSDISLAPIHTQDYIKSAWVLQIMEGEDGQFSPNDPVTREQAAKVFVYFLENMLYLDGDLGLTEMNLTGLYTFPFTYKSYYHYISGSKLNSMNENGAYGENMKYENGEIERWYIEEQRNIEDDILPEILRKRYLGNESGDPELVEALMKAVEWGFSKQDETGGFDGSSDEYHSTGFFVEEVGRILLLMQQSGDASAYDEYINKYLEKLHNAAGWLASDAEFLPYYNAGIFDTFTHRYFYYGGAFLYAYKLTGDEVIYEKAKMLILEGISHMTKEGVLPEKGGFDLGYGVTSIHCALRCMFTLDDPMLKSELRDMLIKVSRYIVTKMDNKGNIDTSDSTRSNGQETKRDGETLKTVSERSFYNTLLAMASVSGLGDMIRARDQMAIRQAYMTPPYMEYKDQNYDLAKERPLFEMAETTGNKNLELKELPVKNFIVSQEYSDNSNPEAMFKEDDNTVGWYARKVPQYVEVDLGAVREIGSVTAVFGDYDKRKYTYSIMVSNDGEAWKYAACDLTTKSIKENRAIFDYVNARYVRLWVSQIQPFYQSDWFTDIRSLKIYGIDRDVSFSPVNDEYYDDFES